MSLALARKYRPRNFASVAVQTHVANTLKGAIARGRVAHGYLLCGPRGTGKTTLARVLAMALNCERRGDPALDGEPCGQCISCTRIWSGSASMDVIEIDAASNRGVDDARELRERAMYAPSADQGYKVYIVDEAHMLTREAWNALLKVLEEPPPRVVFVFATTEPQKIQQTAAPVLSRLQRFDLKRIGPQEIRERLAVVLREEGVPFDEDALLMIARAADGGLRDALSLTDQVLSLGDTTHVKADRVREALGLIPEDEYLALLDIIGEHRAVDVFAAVQRLADAGADFQLVLSGLGDVIRAQLAIVLGGALPDVSEKLRLELTERRSRYSAADLLRMTQAMFEIEPLFRKSAQPQLMVESLLVRLALQDRTVTLEEVLRGLGDGNDEPPQRRVSRSESRVAPAYAAAPALESALAAPVAPPPIPVSATQQVAEAAARQQRAQADALDQARKNEPPAPRVRDRVPPPAINAIRARWSDVVDSVRSNGRGALAQAVQRVQPHSISEHGSVQLSYAAVDDTWARAIEGAKRDVLLALQATFEGITAFTIKSEAQVNAAPTASRPTTRLTAEDVQKQRTEQLTSRSPLLDAAVRTLDLELLD